MPIQAPHWTDYLNCPLCYREYGLSPRSPVSLGCGHTLCEHCLKQLNRKYCPFDQTIIQGDPEELPVNTALLQIAGYSPPLKRVHPPCIQSLPEIDRHSYDVIVTCLEQLAAYLKICANNTAGNRLSRPMQRKLVTLLQCAITDEEGRCRAARAARSLGERSVTELILQHQNPQQLGANLWAAVRARGCQFLGPGMQEEVLKLVLLALEDGSSLSRKVLVMFVVQRLERAYPQASKTSIGHVVQLLYRASCFKVSKRECDSSLMQLKEEFRTYETLRREHDAQIVQIATEAGLRIAPDQWSSLLYGDISHKSHMQSIIDKLQTPQSFAQSVQELFIALQRSGDPCQSVVMSLPLDRLANIDPSLDANCPSWQALADIVMAVRDVVSGLVSYLQHQAAARDANHNQKHTIQEKPDINASQQSPPSPPERFKMAACRDSDLRSGCPRGNNCTFVHFDDSDTDRFKPLPAGYISNGQIIPFPPVTSMHVPSASNSPPFAMSNQTQYHSILQQRALQNFLMRQSDEFNAGPNMHGMLPPAPMLRRHDVPAAPVNYEPNGDSFINSQLLPNRNDMGGNMGATSNATLSVPDSNPPPLFAHHNAATPGGAYGPGVIMSPVAINRNNMLMPMPERTYYRSYPGVLRVITDDSPNNFYSDAINYPQYQNPPAAPYVTTHPFIPVQQEPNSAFNANPDIYPISQAPNYAGPMPEYQVSQDSNYAFNNMNLPAEYRDPPGFPPMPREPRAESYWNSSTYELENFREAMSQRTPLFNVLTAAQLENAYIPSDRRAVGADRSLVAERPPPPIVAPTTESDEHTLEEEMMALERRIDTEFKIS